MTGLPSPPADALALGEQLAEHIRGEVMAAGGALPFSRYMELCLYSPGLGYYSAGTAKFGEAGDFVTAPEISPLFAEGIARSLLPVLDACSTPSILEFGAGSGRIASVSTQFGNRQRRSSAMPQWKPSKQLND